VHSEDSISAWHSGRSTLDAPRVRGGLSRQALLTS